MTASPDRYPRALVAVDVAAFTVRDAQLHVLLVRRGLPPHLWALPGGFVRCGDGAGDAGEDLVEAARRELLEETGAVLTEAAVPLLQVGVFGAPDRDPRARVVAVAFGALLPPSACARVQGGSDAAQACFVDVQRCAQMTLAFDHAAIVLRARAHIAAHLTTASAGLRALQPFIDAPFTAAELRHVWEALTGGPVDAANFRRRLLHAQEHGDVLQVKGTRPTGKRPAGLFTFGTTLEGGVRLRT